MNMGIFRTVFGGIGLIPYINSPFDVKVLSVQRFIRQAAYNGSALVLVFYLLALGNSPSDAGILMTLTTLGDVVMSSILSLVADTIGRRRTLAFSAIMMTVTGILWIMVENYWALLVISVLGVISPSGKEIGRFAAIEESVISQHISFDDRSSVFAWFYFVGGIGTAFGSEATGLAVQGLQAGKHWRPTQAYKLVFAAYAVAGIFSFALCFGLSGNCEVDAIPEDTVSQNNERRPLLLPESSSEVVLEQHKNKSRLSAFVPNISWQSTKTMSKLSLLLGLDSLASGLSPAGWMAYFFHRDFGFDEKSFGTIFFIGGLLCAMSIFAGPAVARRLGLVSALVLTHAITAIALLLMSFVRNPIIAATLFLLRASMSGVDQAPKQAFLSAAVPPSERTAGMGIVNGFKNLCQCLGPLITGYMAKGNNLRATFILSGTLKLVYDGLLLGMLLNQRSTEQKEAENPDLEASWAQQNGRTDEHAT